MAKDVSPGMKCLALELAIYTSGRPTSVNCIGMRDIFRGWYSLYL
jgi:hypothetical protein